MFNKRKFFDSYCYDNKYNIKKISSILSFLNYLEINPLENGMTINYNEDNTILLYKKDNDTIDFIRAKINDKNNMLDITSRKVSTTNNEELMWKEISFVVQNGILKRYVSTFEGNEEVRVGNVPIDYNITQGIGPVISHNLANDNKVLEKKAKK